MALATAAARQTVGRLAGTLELVLSSLGQVLFVKVDLKVGAVVVVPVLLAVDRVADAKEERLAFQIGRVGKLDRDGEAVTGDLALTSVYGAGVFANHLRGGLPAIESEAAGDELRKGEVGDADGGLEGLLVLGQPYLFQASRHGLADEVVLMRKVCGGQLPLKGRGAVLVGEGVLGVTLIGFYGRRAGTNSQWPVNLEEVADMFEVGVEMNSLGKDGGAWHAERAAMGGTAQSRPDELARLFPDHLRLVAQVLFRLGREGGRVVGRRGEAGMGLGGGPNVAKLATGAGAIF